MCTVRFLITLFLILAVSSAMAATEKRVALVIGNDTYESFPNLKNASRDAQGVADRLRQVGFEVILSQNVERRALGRALAEFQRKLTKAEVGLVFYAGHGI